VRRYERNEEDGYEIKEREKVVSHIVFFPAGHFNL